MPASPASASSSPSVNVSGATRLLVVSLSWLGDCVMAMPALAALGQRLPGVHLAVLAKPAVAPLWELMPAVSEVLPLRRGFTGMRETVRAVRRGGYELAYVLPKSFRAAWIPFVARVPGRRGMPGHGRDWMLTETAPLSAAAAAGHQSLEMADVLRIPHDSLALPPFLKVPAAVQDAVAERLAREYGGTPGPLVALFPGAAYGPSKRWPAARFAEVGRHLVREDGSRLVVLGSAADHPLCAEVVAGIGGGALNWAGQTSLHELAGVLGLCRVVLANDSGGMHLAAGLGRPVVGIFGLTDPLKTAPLGPRSRILAARGVSSSRDIPRDSAAARAAMESITVEQVLDTLRESG